MSRVHGEVTEAVRRALRQGDASSQVLADTLRLPRSTVTVIVSRLHAARVVHVCGHTEHVKVRGQHYLRAVYRWGEGEDEPPSWQQQRIVQSTVAEQPTETLSPAVDYPPRVAIASVFDWARAVGGEPIGT